MKELKADWDKVIMPHDLKNTYISIKCMHAYFLWGYLIRWQIKKKE